MLKRLTLVQSIILVVLFAFAVAAWSVMLIADRQLRETADRSQTEIYAERIDKILQYLKERDDLLRTTGMRDAYIDQFQQSALQYLARAYDVDPSQKIYPFIQSLNGEMMLHPIIQTGDNRYVKSDFFLRALHLRNGEFDYDYLGEPKWAIVRTFEPWGWIVGFAIPKELKYKDVRTLRLHLAFTLTAITVLTCGGVLLVLWRMTNPIRELTRAALAISKGNLDFSTPVEGKGDINILAQAFVSMRESVRERIDLLNHEIAERRRAEMSLSNLQKYLASIIDSMPSAIIGLNVDCIVTQWNIEAEKMTGLSAQEALGGSLEMVMPQMSGKLEKIREAMRTRKVLFDPKQAVEDKGMIRYEDITVYPLLDNGVEGVVIRIDDVTERVRLEQMMVQSEKMMSVGGLAAGMAHEINNPLAGIAGNLCNIQNRIFGDLEKNTVIAGECGVELEKVREYLRKRGIQNMINGIKESSERASLIIRNMLSFSRKSEKQFVDHDITELLDLTLDLAASDYDLKRKYDFRKISISKDYAEDIPKVSCDGNEIQQVFFNILKNAAEAIAEKEYTEDVPRFKLKAFTQKEWFVVQIEDNGPGLDNKTRKHIFEPFYTTKPAGQGTGLGLSVSYFIIADQHQGDMTVESELGEWTRFTMKLPINRKVGDTLSES